MADLGEVTDHLAGPLDRHGRRYATRLGVRITGGGVATRGGLCEVATGGIRPVVIDLDGASTG